MSQDRWQDVKAKVEGLGLKLKLHLEQENQEDEATHGNDAGSQAQAAIEEMGAKVQDAVNSLGNAAKDPAIRADLKDLGELLRDAMNETISTVTSEVGDVLKKTKGQKAAEQDAVAEVASDAAAAGEDAAGDPQTGGEPDEDA